MEVGLAHGEPLGRRDRCSEDRGVMLYLFMRLWTLLDRRSRHYERLHGGLRLVLRFVVGGTLIGYGMAKVIQTQFPFPEFRMEQRYGDSSPMGLLWTFMGFSYGYNLFSLSLDPRWERLRGFDIAPNGIEAGRQIASHFQLGDRVSFDRIDLTDAGDPHLCAQLSRKFSIRIEVKNSAVRAPLQTSSSRADPHCDFLNQISAPHAASLSTQGTNA
jgi:hypothetical protein